MNRITAIDLARGFTVLFIPAIHCVILYSSFEVHHSLLGTVFAFIAEWPGAQILMLLMGVSFALSRSNSPKKVLRKVIALLVIGYLMNYLKFVLPIQVGIMPKDFLALYANGQFTQLDYFLTGDIMQFAAISLVILLLVSRSAYSALVASYLAVAVILVSPLLWDLQSDNLFLNHLLSLLVGKPPNTYFPLFPWLVYPLAGFAIGIAIKIKYHKLYRDLFVAGTLVFLFEYLTQFTKFHFTATSFYRTNPDGTLMHLAFVVAWFAMWHYISKKYARNKFFSLLIFMSKNITLIYFIQWVLIFCCFPLFGYHRLALGMSIAVSVSMSAITFFIVYAITNISQRRNTKTQNQTSSNKKHFFSYES
jgi:uncharacterized membrane protein